MFTHLLNNMSYDNKSTSQTLLVDSEMQRRATEDTLAKCNVQKDSPLFTILPAELRNIIFELATQPYDDPSNPYKESDYYYRPGHHAKQKSDIALLLTCRLIWLESNHLPLQQACPTFWFKAEERRPEWTRRAKVHWGRYALRRAKTEWISEEGRFTGFMKGLGYGNGKNLREMQFFGQLAWLESSQLKYLLQDVRPIPPRIIVTVRHTDWWWWENDQPLTLDTEWITSFLLDRRSGKKAEEFVLELETLNSKVEHLQNVIIEKVKKDCGNVEGWVLQEGAGKEVASWTGPTTIGGRTWTPYAARNELNYKVFSLVWKKRGWKAR